MLSEDAPKRSRAALIWGAAAATVIVLAAATPLGSVLAAAATYVPRCPFKQLTGLPCPLCGTTRAAVDLAHLDVGGALLRYPLPALAWLALLAGGLVAGTQALRRQPLPWPRRWPPAAWWGVAVALGLSWIYSVATGV